MCMLCALFWVIPRRLNFICRRFGTVSHLHRRVGTKDSSYLPAYEDGTECSETSAHEIQPPENYPEESVQHSEHGESLKSRVFVYIPIQLDCSVLETFYIVTVLVLVQGTVFPIDV